MFLDSVGSTLPEAWDPLGSNCITDPAETLAAMVRIAFPCLPMNYWRIDETGGDHVLLVVENTIVFRFPRAGTHDLNLEIAVLRRLKTKLSVATPSYDYIDPAVRFAGYRYLSGSALTPARFAELPENLQDEFARSIAQFLSELHRLAPNKICPKKCWPRTWTAAQFSERGMVERVALLSNLIPSDTGAIERFYKAYRQDHPPSLVVVHGDLVPEHILLDETMGQLSGIIDFGDIALGDPAQDLLGFWVYGEDFVRRVVDLYHPACADPGLLERSRNHFIRYRLDQLYESRGHSGSDLLGAAADIEALIAI